MLKLHLDGFNICVYIIGTVRKADSSMEIFHINFKQFFVTYRNICLRTDQYHVRSY